MGHVTVVGSSNTDLVCRADRLPSPGETVAGLSFAVFAGGKGANQAVAAARAGAAVSFVGAVGGDDFGRARLADLQADGIDVAGVLRADREASGVASIVVDARGENQIVVVPGANARVSPAHVHASLDGVASDVIGLVLEIPMETVEAALRAIHTTAVTVLNAAPYDPRIVDLLPLVDVLICNETEASLLLGRAVSVASAEGAVRDLLVLGPRSAVITLGADGAVATDGETAAHVMTPRIDVVDTTGSGDAFCGAFMAWLAAGESIWEAVRAGVAAGTVTATFHGAQSSLPRRPEIVTMMAHLPR